jgi:carbonic anhydrase/acetyltransferase-like protein (isoleucine patch superfamily)
MEPSIDPTAYVAPTAVLVGNVQIGPRARIMYGAVLDSGGSRIEIGECSVVCENAVIRATGAGDKDYPVTLGDHVFVSPHSTLLGCTVEPCSYIATGATVLQGSLVKAGAAVAVGALVHAKTVVPAKTFVPPNMIAVGDPVRILAPDDKDLPEAIAKISFAKTAFAAEAEWEDRIERYRQATEARSKEFEAHSEDKIVDE